MNVLQDRPLEFPNKAFLPGSETLQSRLETWSNGLDNNPLSP